MLEEKLALLRDDLKPMNTRGDMSCNAEANLNGEPSKKIANFRTLIAPAVVKNYVKNVWSRFVLVRTMMNAKGPFSFINTAQQFHESDLKDSEKYSYGYYEEVGFWIGWREVKDEKKFVRMSKPDYTGNSVTEDNDVAINIHKWEKL
ncbi:hypothetical protein Tco_0829955 [Tanacetum coccineum]